MGIRGPGRGPGRGRASPKFREDIRDRVDHNKPTEKSGEICCMTLGMF